jgi:hypothetical protein
MEVLHCKQPMQGWTEHHLMRQQGWVLPEQGEIRTVLLVVIIFLSLQHVVGLCHQTNEGAST